MLKNLNMENLSIIEIEAYINLCYRRSEKLAKSLSLYPGDKDMHEEYEKNYKIIEMLEEEANKRINDLIK